MQASYKSKLDGCLCYTRPFQKQKAFSVSNRREYARREPLVVCAATQATAPYVSVEWLQGHLTDVSVIDVRGRVDTTAPQAGVEVSSYVGLRDEYLEGHIPGAVFWDWTSDAIDTDAAAPVQLQLDEALFAAAVEEKGISHDRPVVAYDSGDTGSMFACRVWWSLKEHGHPDVYVLQGGWREWLARGGATELYEPCPLKLMAYYEGQRSGKHYAGKEAVLQAARGEAPDLQLLDVRSEEQFCGRVRRAARGGRVPRAISLPYKRLLDGATGAVVADVPGLLAAAGLDLEKETILYCNGGVSACVAAAAMSSAGLERWRVYDGSWNEWGNDAELPVE